MSLPWLAVQVPLTLLGGCNRKDAPRSHLQKSVPMLSFRTQEEGALT
jgi:hypothetical protein